MALSFKAVDISRKDKMKCAIHILVFVCLGYVSALPMRSFYNYGTAQGDSRLTKADDISSPEIQLRSPIFFYDDMYTSIFVSIPLTSVCSPRTFLSFYITSSHDFLVCVLGTYDVQFMSLIF